jgi:hypothetical protein
VPCHGELSDKMNLLRAGFTAARRPEQALPPPEHDTIGTNVLLRHPFLSGAIARQGEGAGCLAIWTQSSASNLNCFS